MIAIDMEMPESCRQCEFEKFGECFILTTWMRRQELGAAYRQTMTVTAVRSGTVTLTDGEREYEMPEHEAWRVGDRAECIMLTRGTASKEDDEIAHAEYVWRK